MKELLIRAEIENPLDGILPNFTIFGTEFNELWQKLVAGVWALGLLFSIVFIILGAAKMARNDDDNPHQRKQGQKQFMWACISLGFLAALAVVVGAVLTLFG